ncbi:HD-GYP domain-containing protein [Natroniella sp. ANB-PHB2]|uniref:HD-GYP domain-containing protein n=1 Tax=Natroniella sp. ANB-PHB2 TaxID=3384444 RepID=UPI0038D3CD89
MILTKLSSIEEGSVLAKDIYSSNGNILLKEGSLLTKDIIKKLKGYGITHVYVKTNLTKNIKPKRLVKESTKKLAVTTAKKYITAFNTENISINKSKKEKKLFNQEELLDIIDELLNDIFNNENLLVNLRDIRKLDDELFFHSTNVTILSLIIAKILNYHKKELRPLGLGAFLHDIGKIKIPSEILNKKGKLSDKEFEKVKEHSAYSYQTLISSPNIPEISAIIAHQHHEKCDGSGYPLGLSKEDIHPFSRIVTIADIFDALQNNRSYRNALKNKEIIKHLTSMTKNNQLDNEIIKKVLNYLVPFPSGSRVRLYNKTNSLLLEGIVIEINNDITKPLVQILKINNRKIDKPLLVNLEKELTDYNVEEVI